MGKLLDSFVITLGIFLVGALAGALILLLNSDLLRTVIGIFQLRMVGPIQAASGFGGGVLALMIFVNNSIPAFLSYLYPFLLAKISWHPPLSKKRRAAFLRVFGGTVAFLLGLFGLGAGLALGWFLGGMEEVYALLKTSWLHGPLEFGAVLLCASEPLRLTQARSESEVLVQLRADLKLLVTALIVLFLSSLIEVFALI